MGASAAARGGGFPGWAVANPDRKSLSNPELKMLGLNLVRGAALLARQARQALYQRISLTHVEAGYFYKLRRPLGTVCGRAPYGRSPVDFGPVNRRDGYSSLCALLQSPEILRGK